MNDNEILKAAVAKLDSLLKQVPAGPWVYRYDGGDTVQIQAGTALASDGGMYDSEDMIYERDGMDGLYDTSIDLGGQGEKVLATAQFIARMGPSVAAPLATWLDVQSRHDAPEFIAVIIARQILGDVATRQHASAGVVDAREVQP